MKWILLLASSFLAVLWSAQGQGQTFDDSDMILTEPTMTELGTPLTNLAGCSALVTDYGGQLRFDYPATAPTGGGQHRIDMQRFKGHAFVQAFCASLQAKEGPSEEYNQDRSEPAPGKPGLRPATD